MSIRPYTYLTRGDIDHLTSIPRDNLYLKRKEVNFSAWRTLERFQNIEDNRLFKISPDYTSTFYKQGERLIRIEDEQETEVPKDRIPDTLTIFYILEMGYYNEYVKLVESLDKPLQGGSIYCKHEFIGTSCLHCGGQRH